MQSSSEEDLSDAIKKCVVSEPETEVQEEKTPAPTVIDEGKKLTPGRQKLYSWLNNNFRIVMTDGRILIGMFLCTDANANVILGMCSEFTVIGGEERVLGLVIVPGKHIVSMEVDATNLNNPAYKNSNLNAVK